MGPNIITSSTIFLNLPLSILLSLITLSAQNIKILPLLLVLLHTHTLSPPLPLNCQIFEKTLSFLLVGAVVAVMQGGLGLLGVGGSGSANELTFSKVEKEYDHHPAESDELELGLGLGLSLGGGGSGKSKGSAWGECGRILTAKDFPSAVSGTKRAADSVSHEGGSPPSISQVVGWPPIRAYRMNSLVSQAKAPRSEEEKVGSEKEKSKDTLKKKICNGNKTNNMFNEKGHLGFVKVNMDGLPIGRKVDLNAHACYETLAQTLEEMFFASPTSINSIVSGAEKKDSSTKTSKLLDGSSEFVLTYEDKEGDWMLVGDVPWGMFLSSVRRLRIMRTSEANGLGPRFQERNEKPRAKPV